MSTRLTVCFVNASAKTNNAGELEVTFNDVVVDHDMLPAVMDAMVSRDVPPYIAHNTIDNLQRMLVADTLASRMVR